MQEVLANLDSSSGPSCRYDVGNRERCCYGQRLGIHVSWRRCGQESRVSEWEIHTSDYHLVYTNVLLFRYKHASKPVL